MLRSTHTVNSGRDTNSLRPPLDGQTWQHGGDSHSQSTLNVVETSDRRLWNDYLARVDPGSLYHRAEWQDVFGFYRLPVIRLAAIRGQQIVGILPMVRQTSRLFGRQLVSLPWFDTAGVQADDAAAAEILVLEARRIAERQGIDSVQIRQTAPLAGACHVRTDKVLMRRQLPSDPDELWKQFSPKVRNQVRKAKNRGLRVERGGGEMLSQFHHVYAENMRDLGSPPHHIGFFDAVFKAFPSQTQIWIVQLGDGVIGAGLTMSNGDRLEIPWASSLRRYNSYCVNHLMYWEILQNACVQGFRWFHFGRSTIDSGPYRFKQQWGAEPVPLHWNYFADDWRAAEEAGSQQRTYQWGTRIWQRLPIWLAKQLGPKIIARVP